ncbi:WXG100 family type VII secretion target [Mycolicibacterium sp. CBMA 226]|uniref:WXG100 family type VII secretion target n=1 Tax=Mycolicibacterium sp. CBMA 226 TaxID=2606611 RepID=UPI0012DF81E6|nr:hypothetical protein [Mycolicibacterium sp. CBMA 226]MUL76460.1 hypothetical protein [Mycolicibacterium sp. CBMA 226]
MPGTSAAGTPTRSQIESWDVGHLESAATSWSATAEEWESHFTSIQQGTLHPGGTAWEGPAADAAQEQAWSDLVRVRGLADGLHSASRFARNGADDIAWAKRRAVTAIDEAEQAGFTVGESLSVTDRSMSSAVGDGQDRQTQAKEFAHDIQTKAQALAAMDKSVASQITTALAPLHALDFPEHGKPEHEPTVQAVDYGFKQSPQDSGGNDQDGGGYKPHDKYPDHKPNGEWGPKNSGVEGDAEAQKAFDIRQKRTHIPIERQKIWVYLTDPKTGKRLRREYDGLEPIPGQPGKYRGLEHKLGSKDPTEHQDNFDELVRSGIPATGTLNGQPIQVTDNEIIRTPRPGEASPAGGFGGAQGGGEVATAGPTATASGSAPVSPTPSSATATPTPGSAYVPGSFPFNPNWGTHMTPQQMIDSGDPALVVIGQQIRQQMQQNGEVDTSGTA